MPCLPFHRAVEWLRCCKLSYLPAQARTFLPCISMPVKCWHSLKTCRLDIHVCSLHVAVVYSSLLCVIHKLFHVSCIGRFSLRSFSTWRCHLPNHVRACSATNPWCGQGALSRLSVGQPKTPWTGSLKSYAGPNPELQTHMSLPTPPHACPFEWRPARKFPIAAAKIHASASIGSAFHGVACQRAPSH